MIPYFKIYIKFFSNKHDTMFSNLIFQIIHDSEINKLSVVDFK